MTFDGKAARRFRARDADSTNCSPLPNTARCVLTPSTRVRTMDSSSCWTHEPPNAEAMRASGLFPEHEVPAPTDGTVNAY
ncbi:hypothetical protein [Streptomyces sp. NBC_00280]|uniref:hypothetical protein n=1 Tax=Streptomyces sp. NBC_00280 TaxID=2975699 RepID=UPI003251CEBF